MEPGFYPPSEKFACVRADCSGTMRLRRIGRCIRGLRSVQIYSGWSSRVTCACSAVGSPLPLSVRMFGCVFESVGRQPPTYSECRHTPRATGSFPTLSKTPGLFLKTGRLRLAQKPNSVCEDNNSSWRPSQQTVKKRTSLNVRVVYKANGGRTPFQSPRGDVGLTPRRILMAR